MKLNKLMPFWVLVMVTAFSGVTISMVGTLFIGDILVSVMAIILLVWAIMENRKIPWLLFLFLTALPLFSLFYDLINSIPIDDFLRGIARNTVFLFSIVAGYWFCVRFSVKPALYWLGALMVGVILEGYFSGEIYYMTIGEIGKFMGGSALIYLCALLFIRLNFIQLLIAFSVFTLCFFILDMRTLGLLWLLTAVISHSVGYLNTLIKKYYWAISVFVLILACFGSFLLYTRTSASFTERREASNSERIDMANDALRGFINKPIVGHGSWQHARNYVSPTRAGKIVGVHSYVLQFAYEYGVMGLLFGLGLLVLIVRSYRKILFLYFDRKITSGVLFVLTYIALELVVNILNSPFAGFARLRIGAELGILFGVGEYFVKDKLLIIRSKTKFVQSKHVFTNNSA